MISFTKTEAGKFSPVLPGPPEVEALLKKRCALLVELADLADQIRRIDDRLHILRINAEMDRERTESEARAETAIKSRKEAG
ncbi:MAG: hypothetical protein ACP5PV_01395 [Methanothrix sp.]